MTETKTSIAQDLEHLFKKSTEANQVFLSESVKFVRQLGASRSKSEDLLSVPKQLFQDAINMFVKLNIQHASNLVDLGIAISKRMNQQTSPGVTNTPNATSGSENHPVFTISISGRAGEVVNAEFLLDSDKQEPVICNLIQSEYVLQNNPSVQMAFETKFSPQSLQLLPREPQKISITINIPQEANEGVYQSNILVQEFDHTYFTLILHITSGNGSINQTSE